MRWLTNFYDFRFKWTATTGIGIHPTKAWLSQLMNFKNAIWTWGHFRRTICNKIVLNLEKMPQKPIECFRLLLAHQFLSRIRNSRKAGSLREMMRGVGGVRKSIDQSWLAKGLGWGLGLLCWGFNGVQKHSSNRVSSISTRTMHQSTTPFLSQTIWPRWGSRQFLTLPIVQTLVPMTFGYSLSSEAVVMRQLRIWKRLWRRSLTRSHKRTSMGPSRSCWNGTTSAFQPEEITWKGLHFHECTINKSAHTKKVWKLIVCT